MKWAYKVVTAYDSSELEELANALGAEGWELASFVRNGTYTAFFKKKR